MRKPLPVGFEDFRGIIEEGYYYVDKTLLIRDLIDKKASVDLFTRPRRFGKTLTLSMLRYYFEDARDRCGNKKDYRPLFEGLKIAAAGEKYSKYQGQYPVISLTLQGGKQLTFHGCITALKASLADEFQRHRYILAKDCLLSAKEKERYEGYMNGEADTEACKESLRFLCRCLEDWHGQKVIVLLDEYDVPLEGSYDYGFYPEMSDFIRGLFEATLKTNAGLYFAVITGCLRISRESIFTGLNNMEVNSVLTAQYGEYFGFTEDEVVQLCRDYDLMDRYPEVKQWYDGYLFGDTRVYNPWSTIKYVRDHVFKKDALPETYWVNTSANAIVRDLIDKAGDEEKAAIESLIAGESLTIPVHEDITYDEVPDSRDHLWNFMLFTGYLTKVTEFLEGRLRYITVKIPNWEVDAIFRQKVRSWFAKKVSETNRSALFSAIAEGSAERFQDELNGLLRQTISFHDAYENFYHGFVTGVLTGMEGYIVKSNREGGKGRSDLFICPLSKEKEAFVLELKVAGSPEELPRKAEDALLQIADRGYARELYDMGYRKIVRYGIAFFSKDCYVRKS